MIIFLLATYLDQVYILVIVIPAYAGIQSNWYRLKGGLYLLDTGSRPV